MVEVTVSRVEIVFANTLKIMEVADEPHALGRQFLLIAYDNFAITAEGDHVMYKLPNDHTVAMQVAYSDAKGNAATVDGDVTWESSDASIVMVQVDDTDTTKCRAVPVGIGQAQITATADADIGDGVRELITTCDIEVVGGEAVSGSIQPVGEPEPITPDNALPPGVDNTLPGGQGGSVDNTLPGAQPGVDNTLPGSQPRPDNTLPGGAEPKRR